MGALKIVDLKGHIGIKDHLHVWLGFGSGNEPHSSVEVHQWQCITTHYVSPCRETSTGRTLSDTIAPEVRGGPPHAC